jgi:hypothetical protein
MVSTSDGENVVSLSNEESVCVQYKGWRECCHFM